MRWSAVSDTFGSSCILIQTNSIAALRFSPLRSYRPDPRQLDQICDGEIPLIEAARDFGCILLFAQE
ncbi:MAG: hypothetical protein AAFW82_09850, partial [Pseudomonadota bacterium]